MRAHAVVPWLMKQQANDHFPRDQMTPEVLALTDQYGRMITHMLAKRENSPEI